MRVDEGRGLNVGRPTAAGESGRGVDRQPREGLASLRSLSKFEGTN